MPDPTGASGHCKRSARNGRRSSAVCSRCWRCRYERPRWRERRAHRGVPGRAAASAASTPAGHRRMLIEAEAHLRDAADAAHARGLGRVEAEREAVARFGSAHDVARTASTARRYSPLSVTSQLTWAASVVGGAVLLAIGVSGALAEVANATFGPRFVGALPRRTHRRCVGTSSPSTAVRRPARRRRCSRPARTPSAFACSPASSDCWWSSRPCWYGGTCPATAYRSAARRGHQRARRDRLHRRGWCTAGPCTRRRRAARQWRSGLLLDRSSGISRGGRSGGPTGVSTAAAHSTLDLRWPAVTRLSWTWCRAEGAADPDSGP